MRHSQLKAFHDVALHGGFSRAAEAVHQAQPALSEHVRRLEQDYDVLLFHRDRKQVRLTPEGEKLFVLTRRMFGVEAEIAEFLTESRAALEGRLRLIVDSAHHVTAILRRFRARHPQVFVTMRTGNSEVILAALRTYDAEIGVVGEVDPGREFDRLDLGSTPIIAIAARTTFGTQPDPMSLAQIARLPLVFREPASRTRARLEQEAARQGIALTPAIEVEGREAMREMVASGAGVGFVSDAEFGHDSRFVRIPLIGTRMAMSETLVHLGQRRDLRLIRAFMEQARAAVTPP